MKSKALPWMKSNPSKYNPAKQDFIAKAISSTEGGFHPSVGVPQKVADFFGVLVDGFDCVFSVKDNTHSRGSFFVNILLQKLNILLIYYINIQI